MNQCVLAVHLMWWPIFCLDYGVSSMEQILLPKKEKGIEQISASVLNIEFKCHV